MIKRSNCAVLGVFAAAICPAFAQADVLVGWHTWASGNEAAGVTSNGASGLATEVSGNWLEGTEAASNDESYGTVAGAPNNTSGTHIGATTATGSYDFTITAGANGLTLEGFHLDVRRKRAGSPNALSVTVTSGSITNGLLGSPALGGALGGNGPTDHIDVDFDLTTRADNVLAPGESVTIRLAFSGGTVSNTDQKTYLDNVAYTGTEVPEPGSLALLGLGGLLIARRRR